MECRVPARCRCDAGEAAQKSVQSAVLGSRACCLPPLPLPLPTSSRRTCCPRAVQGLVLLPQLALDGSHATSQQEQQQQQQPQPWQRHDDRLAGPRWRRRLAKLTEECKAGLWAVAKAAPDLHTLVMVQQQTTLNFFQPFGKLSGRDFTLLAPTDAAWRQLFGGCWVGGGARFVLKRGCRKAQQ